MSLLIHSDWPSSLQEFTYEILEVGHRNEEAGSALCILIGSVVQRSFKEFMYFTTFGLVDIILSSKK